MLLRNRLARVRAPPKSSTESEREYAGQSAERIPPRDRLNTNKVPYDVM